jgi:hypothetical protein
VVLAGKVEEVHKYEASVLCQMKKFSDLEKGRSLPNLNPTGSYPLLRRSWDEHRFHRARHVL